MNAVHLGLLVMSVASFEADPPPEEKHHVPGVELSAVVEGHNRFAWEAYARLRERPGNIAFSPFSLASGLAMVQAGARGQTADQIGNVLHLPADNASAHRAFGVLHRGLTAGEAGPRGVKLTSANSLWAARGLRIFPEYVATIHEQYQSVVNEASFADDPESARRIINEWVKSRTDGKIAEFFKAGTIDRATQFVLANALTFQGNWAAAFKKERTRTGPFRVASRRQVPVSLMEQTGKFRLAATAAGQALELPYTGPDVALVLLLPRQPDGLPELEKQLTGSALSEWLRQLKPETVTVTLPRFAITAESDLQQPLAQLGMPLAFRRDGADFTGLCSNEQPFALSSVAQQVSITVDEAGTEAHAATGIRSSRGLASLTKHEFRADRPFVFLVRDMRTGCILFLGRLTDPVPAPRDER
jgi:serpin B